MRRVLVLLAVLALMATLGAAPTAAQERSCVGQFASGNAQVDGFFFGAAIRVFADENQPFGQTSVSPFAHAPRDNCP